MKRFALAVVAGLTLVAFTGVADAVGTWGSPFAPPAMSTLTADDAEIRTIACASDALCIGAGGYTDGSGDDHAFLTERVGGTWGDAFQLPGVTAVAGLNFVMPRASSCAPDGGCALIGDYNNGSGSSIFVANRGGGGAIDVPGLAALDLGHQAMSADISCVSVGNCSATGTYNDGAGHYLGFVVDMDNGVWGNATAITGLGAFTNGSMPMSISCSAPGECSVVGIASNGLNTAFTLDRVGGVWGSAVPLTGFLPGTQTFLVTVSCPTTAFCLAGGGQGASTVAGMVMVRENGVWGSAQAVPGLAVLAGPASSVVSSVDCWAAGDCATAGHAGPGGAAIAWVADMTGAALGTANEVPGVGTLGSATNSDVKSVDCSVSGLCTLAGQYDDNGVTEAFASARTGGVWTTAHPITGLGAVDPFNYADPDGTACAPTFCVVGGGFTTNLQLPKTAWLVEYTDSATPTTTTTPNGPVTPAFTG